MNFKSFTILSFLKQVSMKMTLHVESACNSFADKVLPPFLHKVIFLSLDEASVNTDVKWD